MSSKNLLFIAPNASIADALRERGYALDFDCGGRGLCGKCRVDLVDEDGSPRSVLACQTRAGERGAYVDVSTLRKRPEKIFAPEESWGRAGREPTSPERRGKFGLAVDLGTTTIACALVSLATGRVLGATSSRNPQTAFGRDVLTRIDAAGDSANAAAMRRDAALTIAESARKLTASIGVGADAIEDVAVAGNTTMERLFAGLDVRALGVAPFVVDSKTFRETRSSDFNGAFPFDARIRMAPVFSAFVGGDALAGFARLRRLGAFSSEQTALFLDVGTNGESILGAHGRFYATSTAAGPAFEGSGVSQGSLAVSGAIGKIEYDASSGAWRASTIDGAPARSVCGSGLIDALSGMLDLGALGSNGRIRRADAPEIPFDSVRKRLRDQGKERAFLISNEREPDVWIDQRDARQAQLALGAMKAGAGLTLRAAGVEASSLDSVYLAGGFGASLNRQNARRVGALPGSVDVDKISYCGNTSLWGAVDVLTGAIPWKTLEETTEIVESVDLAAQPDFADVFAESLKFPAP